jgi:hypothetical protein
MPENIDTRSAIVKPEVDLSAPKPVVGDHERTDGAAQMLSEIATAKRN